MTYARFMQEYNEAKGLKIGSEVAGVFKTVNHIHYLMSITYRKGWNLDGLVRQIDQKRGGGCLPFFALPGNFAIIRPLADMP